MAGERAPPRAEDIQVPAGRFRYQPVEQAPYVVIRHPAFGLWVADEGWTIRSRAAGPFRMEQVLRALRLANTRVPQGCELGPWQSGLELFTTSPLPAHPNDWERVEEDWLPPSISRYAGSSIDRVVNETCCAPPTDRPRISFDRDQWQASGNVRARIEADWAALNPTFEGVLVRPWNAHPEGSVVFSQDRDLEGDFAVVDLPRRPA